MTGPAPRADAPLRLAIISTPRTGNTWLRWLLREAYALDEVAVHSPAEIPSPLPRRVVLQLHWHRTQALSASLDADAFRILVLSRHPLDVLVSILHFVTHEPLTARWLDGEGAVGELPGRGPTSPEFARYAVGPGAAALLSVSREWWARPGVVGLRYEDLVDRTAATLRAVCERIGVPPRRPLAEAIARCPLVAFQDMPNHHGWLGTPGLWKRLVVPDLAHAVARAHRGFFEDFGYACDPDPALTAVAAEATWRRLAVPSAGAEPARGRRPAATRSTRELP